MDFANENATNAAMIVEADASEHHDSMSCRSGVPTVVELIETMEVDRDSAYRSDGESDKAIHALEEQSTQSSDGGATDLEPITAEQSESSAGDDLKFKSACFVRTPNLSEEGLEMNAKVNEILSLPETRPTDMPALVLKYDSPSFSNYTDMPT